MNIHLQFSISPDEYVECVREIERRGNLAATGREPPKPAFRKFTWILVAVLGAILYLGLGITSAMQGAGTGAFSVRATVTILCGAGLLTLYLMRHKLWEWILRRTAKGNAQLAEKQEVTLRDEGMETRTETVTTIQLWNHFTAFAETRTLFLLMMTDKSAQLLPKRAFESPQAIDEFRGFALARIGRQVLGFPVQQP